MYTFKIKDNTPDINILVSRCLLVLAGVGALIFRSNHFYLINVIVAMLLFATAISTNILLKKFKLNYQWPLIAGALVLIIATHSILFSAILVLFDALIKKLYRQPIVTVDTEGVIIKKTFGNTHHGWMEFNNIILKDDLLSLDFKDNKLWQLNIIEEGLIIEEENFNAFCNKYIGNI